MWCPYLPPAFGVSLPDSVLLGLEVSGLQEAGDAKGLMSCEHPAMRDRNW